MPTSESSANGHLLAPLANPAGQQVKLALEPPELERNDQHVDEHDVEEDELALAPQPPVAPRDLRPQRTGEQCQHAEDDALVDGDVAFEVGSGLAFPKVAEGLPRPPAEEGVGGQRDRDVYVEDPLRE